MKHEHYNKNRLRYRYRSNQEQPNIEKNVTYLSRILNQQLNKQQKVINLTTIGSEFESQFDQQLAICDLFLSNLDNKINLVPVVLKMQKLKFKVERSEITTVLQFSFPEWLSPFIEIYLLKSLKFDYILQKCLNKLSMIFLKVLEKQEPQIAEDIMRNNINYIEFVTISYKSLMGCMLQTYLHSEFVLRYLVEKQAYLVYFLCKILTIKQNLFRNVESTKDLIKRLRKQIQLNEQELYKILKQPISEEIMYRISKWMKKLQY